MFDENKQKGEIKVATESLSKHTQLTRRNLLLISFAIIVVNIFDLAKSGVKLPFVIQDGSSLTPMQVDMVSIVVLIYLFISFVIYFRRDYKNGKSSNVMDAYKTLVKQLRASNTNYMASVFNVYYASKKWVTLEVVQFEKFGEAIISNINNSEDDLHQAIEAYESDKSQEQAVYLITDKYFDRMKEETGSRFNKISAALKFDIIRNAIRVKKEIKDNYPSNYEAFESKLWWFEGMPFVVAIIALCLIVFR